ncbi:WUSCHEL-related homeobox 1B-like [Brachypodium distachyon]|uniref:Homeobox domain-containing protein n=1 Tax=Brachypodium distachyon TaxID=15368 RepID=A0A0Q3KYH2_BRADI|nr:WUSCHEL-related homeobox 1B-like [Brachypodium distachyon]KQJ85141.1 hypothetical protein BRADI_5g25113v3 [Brachypodium distachyon]|eukprot:XP_024311863.1 WUSCHEL-related homeobox 1B-like [Brachypodium distachyon]
MDGAAANGGQAAPCRASGTRWTPTAEQVRILRELYYGLGIRSPNAEQIQRIAGRLRQYGRIEGKNVFYWFQNHKARERHKKRLTTIDVSPNNNDSNNNCSNNASILSLSPSSGAAAGLYGAGSNGGGGSAHLQMDANASATCWDVGSNAAMANDRSFMQLLQEQDYMGVRTSTAAMAPTPWPACFPAFSPYQPPPAREPETLPLFPTGGGSSGGHQEIVNGVHGGSYQLLQSNSQQLCWGQQHHHHHQLLLQEQQNYQYSSYSSNNQLMMPTQDAAAAASLELTLSSHYPAGSSM